MRSHALRWYAAKVREGSEERAACALRSVLGDLVVDCIVPKTRLLRKSAGVWGTVDRVLYPGYVFIVASAARDLGRAVASSSVHARLVARQADGGYTPLMRSEQALLESVLDDGQVLQPSTGCIRGGATTVVRGPLAGWESRIRKIDRHKRLAFVELGLPDGDVLVKAALEIPLKE